MLNAADLVKTLCVSWYVSFIFLVWFSGRQRRYYCLPSCQWLDLAIDDVTSTTWSQAGETVTIIRGRDAEDAKKRTVPAGYMAVVSPASLV